jgi:uncharacterized protein YoxC
MTAQVTIDRSEQIKQDMRILEQKVNSKFNQLNQLKDEVIDLLLEMGESITAYGKENGVGKQ